MASDDEEAMKNLTDKATYDRLEKDLSAVKNDISALADQVSDALGTFTGSAKKQARRGYKQARANVDSVLSDVSERGNAAFDAAQNAVSSIEAGRSDPATPSRNGRACHRPGIFDRRDLASMRRR